VTRGRPAKLYALTDAGHAAGPLAYDSLAASALRFMTREQVDAFADARGRELEGRYAGVASPVELAVRLSEDGYAASVSDQGLGVQLCQHHCPVQHVAAEFPQLCDAETAALGRLLDVHVQRLATIAHGDGVCTTFVPTAGKASS
jgi:predicted ArsR family transcriptional regulator